MAEEYAEQENEYISAYSLLFACLRALLLQPEGSDNLLIQNTGKHLPHFTL
jgi:hypothetical protein